MIAGGELDEALAVHVIDDIVLPLLAGSVGRPALAGQDSGRARQQEE